jgi:hypothetical protein
MGMTILHVASGAGTQLQKEKARHCRALEEYLFRSVHFASLAI